MMTRRTWTVLVAALALALALGGCTTTADDSDSNGAALPPQDGLEVGEAAPDFRLKNQDQETVALSDFSNTKNVVLVFYPLAFTPV